MHPASQNHVRLRVLRGEARVMGRCGLGDDVRLRHTRALGEGGQGARKGLLIWMQGAREVLHM